MKNFIYDVLLTEGDICNLVAEREAIEKAVESGKKVVVYGPRNFGKTSLVKNVIIPGFRKRNEDGFVFFADLMEVKSLESINRRILKGFEISFEQSFRSKNFMEVVKQFLANLRPQVSVDPVTGSPTLSITPQRTEREDTLEDVFRSIMKIAGERPTLVVLDEFQDIAFIDEAQGLFRNAFQQMGNISIIVMGSKRHILSNIFAKPDAPLAMFGEDVEFKPISYGEYHEYIMERFSSRSISMSFEDSKYLQDILMRIPEAINLVCAEIMEAAEGKTLKVEDIDLAVVRTVEKRSSRYEEYISRFTDNEESVLISLAKEGPVKHPNGQDFLRTVKPTSRMVGLIIRQCKDRSIIDEGKSGYYISDPLFKVYLKKYR